MGKQSTGVKEVKMHLVNNDKIGTQLIGEPNNGRSSSSLFAKLKAPDLIKSLYEA